MPSRLVALPKRRIIVFVSAALVSFFWKRRNRPSILRKISIRPTNCAAMAGAPSCPLSILTDFEEFAVYDCRVKPAKTDKASHSRILYLKYTDYEDRWDEIAGIFSNDAILKGSFDKYVESKKAKKEPPRSIPLSCRRSSAGGNSWPAISPCGTRTFPSGN